MYDAWLDRLFNSPAEFQIVTSLLFLCFIAYPFALPLPEAELLSVMFWIFYLVPKECILAFFGMHVIDYAVKHPPDDIVFLILTNLCFANLALGSGGENWERLRSSPWFLYCGIAIFTLFILGLLSGKLFVFFQQPNGLQFPLLILWSVFYFGLFYRKKDKEY